MAQDVRVSVTLAGRHSLEPGGVRGACEAIKRALRDGTTEYTVQSLVPGHELTEHGGRDGLGMVAVRIDGSSFMVVWSDVSSFEAPAAMLDEVIRRLGAAGEVHVRVGALVADVSMEPLKIAGGSLAATFSSTTFRLMPRATEGNGGRGEITFDGVVTMGKNAAVNVVIFAALKSDIPGASGMLGRALGTLSGHCEALAR